MLAICSTCETEALEVTGFDSCDVDLTEFVTTGESNRAVQNGNYEQLHSFLTQHPELGENTRKENVTLVSDDYYIFMSCNKTYPDYPILRLDMQTRITYAALTTAGAFFFTKQEMYLQYKNLNSDVIWNAPLRFCNYTNSAGDTLPDGTPSPSVAKFTCFTSSTDLGLYTDMSKIGQINGTVHKCDLRFCAHHYDSMTVLNGQKAYSVQKKGELTPVLGENWRPDFPVRNWTSDVSPSLLYEIDKWSKSALANQFFRIANDSSNHEDSLTPSGVGNGSSLDNFPLLFGRSADVMTSIIQSSYNPNTKTIDMSVFASDIFVDVRWRWMILPLTIVVTGLLFVVLSILESRNKRYLLKSSILAVMFYGLDMQEWGFVGDDGTKGMSQDRATDVDLAKEAEGIRAVFASDDFGRMKLKKE